MRVLIVGCGYVGIPLGAMLARQGYEVTGLRRNLAAAPALTSVGIQPLAGDLTRLEDLKKLPNNFDWVVNCVSSTGGDAVDYRSVYFQGARNLVAWLRDTPLQKLVYTSSTSVYAQSDGSLVTEKSATCPESETARILVETENVFLQAALERQIPACVLRVGAIYGPGRGYWLNQFLKGQAVIDGSGDRFFNMIHREDVAGVILAALQRAHGGQIYNAVDDEPVSQLDFFRWLATTLNRPLPPIADETENRPSKRGLTNKRVSNQKLKSELAYLFQFPTFREGCLAELRRVALLP